jgi:hypothetical protein
METDRKNSYLDIWIDHNHIRVAWCQHP